MDTLSRRRLVHAAAWTVPVIVVGAPAAQAACSTGQEVYVPDLAVASTQTTSPANGHTVGTFSFSVRNAATTIIPAGTVYSVLINVAKAPGNDGKNVLVTRVPSASFTTTPTGTVSLNPDGPPKGPQSFTATLTLTTSLVPGVTATQTWSVDTETGIGATKLEMTATLARYSTSCGTTGPGGQSTIGPVLWGRNST